MIKTLLPFLLLFSGIISCNSQAERKPGEQVQLLFEKQDPIDRFWKWFQKNEKNLRHFTSNPDEIVTEAYDSLNKIRDGLAIEFEPPKNDIINVTISANGDRDLFAVVKSIVEKAPKIEGWAFVAFRQRMPTDKVKGMVLKARDHELNPDKMKFLPIVSGNNLDIIIYTNGITDENLKQVVYGCLLVVDNILGEYDSATKVRKYDFRNMPTNPEELKELKPLLSLAEYVDNFQKSHKY